MQDPTETQQPTLHLICGRIASGKSTLATELGRGSPILRFRSNSDGPHRNYDTFGGWRLRAVLAASGDPDHANAALNPRLVVCSNFWMLHGVRMSA
jgi:hypothetical protein